MQKPTYWKEGAKSNHYCTSTYNVFNLTSIKMPYWNPNLHMYKASVT